MRWSSNVGSRTGRGVPGWMRSQSGPSSTSIPHARRLRAVASTRSDSLTRAWPMPPIVVGPSAKGATQASVMNTSELEFMSTSTPRSRRGPVSDSGARAPTTQPIASRCATSSMSPWAVASRSRPGSATVVPVTAALARKYEAVETSGSISSASTAR
jgi:hypothetical protein